MYESFYGLSAKPFRLRPDPHFFFASKGHKRAMAYLEYGLDQGEGFIVITGEVGAGKTTVVRNLFQKLESQKIVAANLVNTHLDSSDIVRMVVAAFGLPHEDASKATLLTRLEQFLRLCDRQGKRALLVVDEAQNLRPQAVEELRMLSNFQTDEKCLLQTFLLGQPEFRATLHSDEMLQLRQRVTATYHLGPMDADETRAYIEHRLRTAAWQGDPAFSDDAFPLIHAFTGGVPRKINTLCDRIMLMGYLEELHAIGAAEVSQVIDDIRQESELPATSQTRASPAVENDAAEESPEDQANVDERIVKLEKSIVSVLNLLKKIVSSPASTAASAKSVSKDPS